MTSTTDLIDAPRPRALRRHLPSFIAIGLGCTAAYIVIYALLVFVLPSYAANTVALAVTAFINTAANRRYTFKAHDVSRSVRVAHQVKGAVAFAVGLLLTNGGLWLLHAADGKPAHWLELAVLLAANVLATVTRYVMMRIWVFRGV
jgi:putative flippase GtrA